jgi:predicted transcriptional regulator
MNETIAALMHPGVQTVAMDDSVAIVESFLTEQGRTWAPVTDDLGVVIGAISASDLLLFHAQQRDAQTVRAWQLCSYKPVVVSPQASLAEVQVLGVASALDFVALYARGGGST